MENVLDACTTHYYPHKSNSEKRISWRVNILTFHAIRELAKKKPPLLKRNKFRIAFIYTVLSEYKTFKCNFAELPIRCRKRCISSSNLIDQICHRIKVSFDDCKVNLLSFFSTLWYTTNSKITKPLNTSSM